MNTYMDALMRAKLAYSKALEAAQPMVGNHPDPEVRVYNRLEPTHVDELMHQYGIDEVAKYVKDMETRKMRGVQNA